VSDDMILIERDPKTNEWVIRGPELSYRLDGHIFPAASVSTIKKMVTEVYDVAYQEGRESMAELRRCP
jgi:hypothetical protein